MDVLNTILISNSVNWINEIEETCGRNPYVEVVGTFTDYEESLRYAESHEVHFVVIDIDLPLLDYLNIGHRFRIINPRMIVFFASENDEADFIKNARKASDAVVKKPIVADDIHSFILKASLIKERRAKNFISVRTFGQFEVSTDDGTVCFVNAKAKELFALCVDHKGGQVTMEEAVDKLWPDRPYDDKAKRLYRKAVFCLKRTLIELSDKEIFKTHRGSCSINAENIMCDYFEFLKKCREGEADETLMENYMPEYSWAEYTIAKLYFSMAKQE